MDTFSIERDLTMIMKNARQDFCRIWGRNALGKLCGVTVSTRGSAPSDQYGDEVLGDHRASLTLPASNEDIELVTVPDETTYFTLPGFGESPEPPPLGAMFCDVYEKQGGRMKKVQEASGIEDPADLRGGITGAGIEFFFPPATEDYRETDWELSVPIFRDSLTPSLSKKTVQVLFEYGRKNNAVPSDGDTGDQQRPILKSAI